MDQLRKLIAALTLSQRITDRGAAALVIAGVVGLVHWRKEGDFRPCSPIFPRKTRARWCRS